MTRSDRTALGCQPRPPVLLRGIAESRRHGVVTWYDIKIYTTASRWLVSLVIPTVSFRVVKMTRFGLKVMLVWIVIITKLWLDHLCLCVCVQCAFLSTAYMLYYCNTVGWTWWNLSLVLRTLSSFSALTLLFGSFYLQKPFPDMAYNVFGGMLKLAEPQLIKPNCVQRCHVNHRWAN